MQRITSSVVEFSTASTNWSRGPLLGCGTYARVNMALDMATGRMFAVKTVDSTSFELLNALENERRIMSLICSERVVSLYGADWTTEDGVLKRNLHLELVPGGSLRDILKGCHKGQFEEALFRRYTKGILEALRDIHSLGIVHSDVKCKNVLLGVDGVKLCDFGAAKVLGGLQRRPRHACPLGTLSWMPPEYVTEGEAESTAGDIWSLGCTVIEMATGSNPWGDQSALYCLRCTDTVPQPPPWLSPEACSFLSLCLQRDPRRRPSAMELLSHPFVQWHKQEEGQLQLQGLSMAASPSQKCAFDLSHRREEEADLYPFKEPPRSMEVSIQEASAGQRKAENDFAAFRQYFVGVEDEGQPRTQNHLRLDFSDTEYLLDTESGGEGSRSPGSWSWWSSPSSPMAAQGNWLVVRSPSPRTSPPESVFSPEDPCFGTSKSFSEETGCLEEEASERMEVDEAAMLHECLTFKGML